MPAMWEAVRAEMLAAVGFVEGPNNANPWGPEQGVRNAAYCSSFAHMIPYHHGYRWWPESQFGEKGDAYCPYAVQHGAAHGETRFDHTSKGDPADLLPGDQVFFDWDHNGVADHVETVLASYADRTFDTDGANTGHPEGVHAPIRRDRTYLLCRRRPSLYATPQDPHTYVYPSYQEEDVRTVMVAVGPLETTGKAAGSGWARVDPGLNVNRDPIPVGQPCLSGPRPEVDHDYWLEWKDTLIRATPEAGKLIVTVTGGKPGGTAMCWVSAA